MKKTLMFLGILVALSFIISIETVLAETTEDITTTEISTAPESIYFGGDYYYYSDYQNLVSQVYAEVYDEVYEDIYNQVLSEINNTYYEDIFEAVRTNLANLLNDEEISVYLASFQNKIYDIVDLGTNSVFGIRTVFEDGTAAVGSGVVYKYDAEENRYYMITNHHVIEGAADLEIRFPDESTIEARVIGFDTEVDLAVLTFDATGLDFVQVSPLGNISEIEISEVVIAVGNPIGYDFYNSYTMGIVSGLNRYADTDRFVGYIQHDAAINGGNSGGPIYNLEGEVVGINVSKLADIQIEGIGFAIPINTVKRVIEKIEADELPFKTIKPRIDLSYYVVEEKLVNHNNVKLEKITFDGAEFTNVTLTLPTGVSSGLIIKAIDENGSSAGYFETGDLIYRVGDYIITDENSFLEHLYATYEAGDTLTFYYYEFNENIDAYDNTLLSVTINLK